MPDGYGYKILDTEETSNLAGSIKALIKSSPTVNEAISVPLPAGGKVLFIDVKTGEQRIISSEAGIDIHIPAGAVVGLDDNGGMQSITTNSDKINFPQIVDSLNTNAGPQDIIRESFLGIEKTDENNHEILRAPMIIGLYPTSGSILVIDENTSKETTLTSNGNWEITIPSGADIGRDKNKSIVSITIKEGQENYPDVIDLADNTPVTDLKTEFNKKSQEKDTYTAKDIAADVGTIAVTVAVVIPVLTVADIGVHATVDAPAKQLEDLVQLKTLGERKWEQPFNTMQTKLWAGTALGTGNIINNVTEKLFNRSLADGLISKIKYFAGKNAFGFSTHVDYIKELSADYEKGDWTSFVKHSIDETYETAAMNKVVDPLWKFAGGQKVENFAVETTQKVLKNTVGKVGNVGAKTSNFLSDVVDIRDPDEVIKYANKELSKTENVLNKAKAAFEKNPTPKTQKAFTKATTKFEKAFNKAAELELEATETVVETAVRTTGSYIKPLVRTLAAAAPVFTGYFAVQDYNEATTELEKGKQLTKGLTSTTVDACIAVGILTNWWNPIGWGCMAYAGVNLISSYTTGNSISEWVGEGAAALVHGDITEKTKGNLGIATDEQKLEAFERAQNAPKNLLKTLNVNAETDQDKYSYVVNNDIKTLQLELNKRIKEANQHLPAAEKIKTLTPDGKFDKNTLLAMHKLGIDDDALRLTGLKKQAYNELVAICERTEHGTSPQAKEDAAKLADIHMKRINTKPNFGKVYGKNDIANAIESTKHNPIITEKIAHSIASVSKGFSAHGIDVKNIFPENMQIHAADHTATKKPIIDEKLLASLKNKDSGVNLN